MRERTCTVCGSQLLALRESVLGEETLRETLNIITYELGDLHKCVVYSETRYPHLKEAYMAEAKIALADIITQTRLLAEMLGADFETLMVDGEERFRERMEEMHGR